MSNNQHQDSGGERMPAQQAEEITKEAKDGMNLAAGKAKHIWFGFSQPEKIIAIGAGAGLLAFFLPWVSAGGEYISGFKAGSQSVYAYLLALLMITSLVLLYFTQGAQEARKTLAARWQIVIGSVGATIGLIMAILIRAITGLIGQFTGGFGSLFGATSFSASAGIGAYLFAAGSIAIIVGAFKLQVELLGRRKRE
jgi:hypothetical protein